LLRLAHALTCTETWQRTGRSKRRRPVDGDGLR
jgi:hypothetical protein